MKFTLLLTFLTFFTATSWALTAATVADRGQTLHTLAPSNSSVQCKHDLAYAARPQSESQSQLQPQHETLPFPDKHFYLSGWCNLNIQKLLEYYSAKGIDISEAEVLFLYPGRDAKDIYPTATHNNDYSYSYHVVLLYKDDIYDFDYRRKDLTRTEAPTFNDGMKLSWGTPAKKYFREMFNSDVQGNNPSHLDWEGRIVWRFRRARSPLTINPNNYSDYGDVNIRTIPAPYYLQHHSIDQDGMNGFYFRDKTEGQFPHQKIKSFVSRFN